jgi:hypothetical protein
MLGSHARDQQDDVPPDERHVVSEIAPLSAVGQL